MPMIALMLAWVHANVQQGVTTSEPVVYHVSITTNLIVPDRGVRGIRVWQAIPDKKPWSDTNSELGATLTDIVPGFGYVDHDAPHNADHVFWQYPNPAVGGQLTFRSRFDVRSVKRSFDPAKATTTWPEDYNPAVYTNPELEGIADRIQRHYTPSAAVLEFCKWIYGNITYDAGVPYPYSDFASVMKYKRGMCGHYFALLEQLCKRVDIPIRLVQGLDLYEPNGATASLQKVRADYNNEHSWAEVYFPGTGWVEVDPTAGPNAYTIPACEISCNRWFQIYSVWANENGMETPMAWHFANGSFWSDYRLSNIVSYSVTPG